MAHLDGKTTFDDLQAKFVRRLEQYMYNHGFSYQSPPYKDSDWKDILLDPVIQRFLTRECELMREEICKEEQWIYDNLPPKLRVPFRKRIDEHAITLAENLTVPLKEFWQSMGRPRQEVSLEILDDGLRLEPPTVENIKDYKPIASIIQTIDNRKVADANKISVYISPIAASRLSKDTTILKQETLRNHAVCLMIIHDNTTNNMDVFFANSWIRERDEYRERFQEEINQVSQHSGRHISFQDISVRTQGADKQCGLHSHDIAHALAGYVYKNADLLLSLQQASHSETLRQQIQTGMLAELLINFGSISNPQFIDYDKQVKTQKEVAWVAGSNHIKSMVRN